MDSFAVTASLAARKLDPEVSYLTRWNERKKRVEFVAGNRSMLSSRS
jgi:hypothetical protein